MTPKESITKTMRDRVRAVVIPMSSCPNDIGVDGRGTAPARPRPSLVSSLWEQALAWDRR